MSTRKALLLTGALAAVVTALSAKYYIDSRPKWPPVFLQSGQLAYNWEVKPDFGWRTGNHVPLSLFFIEEPGTRILSDQVSVEGDFNLVQSSALRQDWNDEATYVRIDLTLQTFTFKPRWECVPTVAYQDSAGDINTMVLMPITISSSKTFDGESSKHPKEPELELADDGHLFITTCAILLGVAGLFWSVGRLLGPLVRRRRRQEAESEPTGWQAIQEQWRVIQEGNRDRQAFRQFAASLRRHFDIETLSTSELSSSEVAGSEHLETVFALVNKALWTREQITDSDIEAADAALAELDTISNE